MKGLEDLIVELGDLEKDFQHQINALGGDRKEFHKALIDLTSKYPDHRDLLQFVVFINDKLERNQSQYVEVMTEAFEDSINIKKSLIKEIMSLKNNMPCTKISPSKFNFSAVNIKDIKIIIISLAIIAAAVLSIESPTILNSTAKYIGIIK